MYAFKNSCNNFFIFLCILLMNQEKLAMAVHKYIHQKDASEYCRRHVLPSVFLGRHVLDTNSHVLHFSRLDLPYSCSISVRAESGSNIILVIKSVSGKSLMNSCTKNHHQLLVYEIGETFGGYWAALPDSVMRQEVNNFTELYTLKATKPTTTTMDYSSENENDDTFEPLTEKVKLTENTNSATNGDYIRVEVPLVNVSGKFSIDEFQPQNIDEIFDINNDLIPREGVIYDTSILPIVQFSISAPKGSLHNEITTEDMKFILGYRSGIYTPDSRLIFQTKNQRRQFRNRNRGFANRRLNFKKKLSTLISKSKTTSYRNKFFQTPISPMLVKPYMLTADTSSKITVQRNDSALDFNDLISEHITKPPEITNKVFKSFSHTTLSRKIPNFLLQSILDEHNTSVYLLPNLSANNASLTKYANIENITNLTSKISKASLNGVARLAEITKSSQTITTKILSTSPSETTSREISVNSDLKFQENNSNISTSTNRSTVLNVDIYKIIEDLRNSTKTGTTENLRNYSIIILNEVTNSTKMSKNTKLVTGTMVNHESWENIVQAAPVMAILLNKTLPEDSTESADNTFRKELNSTVKVGPEYLRKKRYIQPLEINNARPRVFTPTRPYKSTNKSVANLVDVQDIAHLVEMKNDEMDGHVALRYMRNYVGPVLFNICDYKELQTRRVYLFNTSRIVIAISNFTLEKMTLIMTPARTLRHKEKSCPEAHLECQISGARVCIDSLSACDGIPNCGSYDIYDEDRLMCGEPSGLQHNVYLAACTFLALLLTLLYTVHYWLKRCVPRVSEAFFIYTDRSENILNLETIMRSPNDDEDDSKIMYGGHFFEDDELDIDNDHKFNENFFKKVWKSCLGICLKNQPKKDEDEETSAVRPPPKRISSFAELELSKIGPKRAFDVYVQTENSSEHAFINKIKQQNMECKELFHTDEYEKLKKDKNALKRKHTDELNILKFMKESRSDSIQSDAVNEGSKLLNSFNKNLQLEDDDEKELLSTMYEPQSSGSRKNNSAKVITRSVLNSEKKPTVQKHLRFDEAATTIPSVNTDEEILDGDEKYRKPHVVLGTEKLRYSGTTNKLEQQSFSSGREFMRFWSGNKITKSKKKKNVTTH